MATEGSASGGAGASPLEAAATRAADILERATEAFDGAVKLTQIVNMCVMLNTWFHGMLSTHTEVSEFRITNFLREFESKVLLPIANRASDDVEQLEKLRECLEDLFRVVENGGRLYSHIKTTSISCVPSSVMRLNMWDSLFELFPFANPFLWVIEDKGWTNCFKTLSKRAYGELSENEKMEALVRLVQKQSIDENVLEDVYGIYKSPSNKRWYLEHFSTLRSDNGGDEAYLIEFEPPFAITTNAERDPFQISVLNPWTGEWVDIDSPLSKGSEDLF